VQGRVAIVTGSSQGIGRAIALELAREGCRVAVTYYRDSDKANAREVLSQIEAGGSGGIMVQADVSRSQSAQDMVEQVVAAFGKVDILVNNAGINKDQLLLRITDQDWEDLLKTNLNSAFYCSRAALKYMVRQRYGCLIHISSVVGISGNAGQAHYAASKSGLLGFSRSLAKEYGARGIRSNVIAPGFIESAMTAALNAEQTSRLLESVAVKRLGQPEDVAAAAVFLASTRAGYITGQVLQVDGGMF